MTAGEVLAEIEPSLPFIRGLTVSGGECTLYPGFLRDLGKLAADRGLSFFLDSNGSYDLLEDPELLELTGAVMLDLKADPDDPAEHRQVTGRDGWDILGRAEALARAGKLWELRTVVSPGLFDAAALVEKACRRLARIRGGFRYKLIRYRPNGVRSAEVANLAVPEEALMDGLTRICAAYGVEAVIL
jgi:pyruvate formate lyase activating enzyme